MIEIIRGPLQGGCTTSTAVSTTSCGCRSRQAAPRARGRRSFCIGGLVEPVVSAPRASGTATSAGENPRCSLEDLAQMIRASRYRRDYDRTGAFEYKFMPTQPRPGPGSASAPRA
ncbi:MAG: hypothetical protein IPF57_13205 [Gammaproteobacteria bacterium]|nr:hypothetical protein [Gammaproteobacteria bacterium]